VNFGKILLTPPEMLLYNSYPEDIRNLEGGCIMNKSGDFIAGLLVGGLIGAVIGILYAPKSGKETREELGQKADYLLTKAKEEYESAVEKSRKAYEEAVQRLKAVEETAREKAEEVEKTVEEIVGSGKETIREGKSRLKKAIDAGVEAFNEEKGKAV
jgi:gas vesicle protein